MSDEKHHDHLGLSPSSLALFQGCNRKYFYKKISKVTIDTDASEDYEAFSVGKAFHKVLEDTMHELDGLSLNQVMKTCLEFELDPDQYAPMILAMLSAYKSMHKKSRLKAVACEVTVETDKFFGIVDAILTEPDGHWWISDSKTTASWRDHTIATLPRHPQLNLYAMHFPDIASIVGLDHTLFRGCRYRVTTKSKLIQKSSELLPAYIERMRAGIESHDYILPLEIMEPESIYHTHNVALEMIEAGKISKDPKEFHPNFGNCYSYFRPCEFWSRCHGKNFSDMKNLGVVSSD